MDNADIKFLKQKDYKLIKKLSRGGFGETVLLFDETINENFVCKKYTPYYDGHKEEYYKNFVQEIKLLHLLNHRNIVRVFNYYLYPDQNTGYILMEFIDGFEIDKYIKENPDKITNIFLQTITSFHHLEELNILHRDIRPQNILVTEKGVLKLIDFGFGKQIQFVDESFDNSVSLNWRYTPPSEFSEKIYDFKTEVYFIGKLFEEIVNENKIEDFMYASLLRRMITLDYNERLSSFSDITREISENNFQQIDFSFTDKYTYKTFADGLVKVINIIYHDCKYNSDIENILQSLETLYNNSQLEEYIQNPSALTSCFLKGGYKYYNRKDFPVNKLWDFIKLFKSMSKEKQKIIINNLWQRLDAINRTKTDIDDLPF